MDTNHTPAYPVTELVYNVFSDKAYLRILLEQGEKRAQW